jgi:hypothetical protein
LLLILLKHFHYVHNKLRKLQTIELEEEAVVEV